MKDSELKDLAKKTLTIESDALREAVERLDDSIVTAIRKLLACKGKIVVSGLGKSGHIARKIAATLSSTGSPSVFLHPAEALHGDFGLLQQGDCLIAIGFGGETHEVLEVIRFAKRLGVFIIGITGKLQSSLAQACDICIDGSVKLEACPMNLAPTSSSTLALALGDAIAVTLMKAREFKEGDFAKLHPAGSLGRKLAQVQDYMRPVKEVPQLHGNASFKETVEAVTRGTFGMACIVDDQKKLVGSISDGDLRRALVKHEQNSFKVTAADVMTKPPKTIQENTLIEDALNLMEAHKITSVFVVNATSKLVGIIRMHDIIAAKLI